MATENEPPTQQVIAGATDISPLTEIDTNGSESESEEDVDNNLTTQQENNNNQTEVTNTSRGRKKGSTNKAKREHLRLIKDATTKIATQYNKIREDAIVDGCNVKAGVLDNLITTTIKESGLPDGCIKKCHSFSNQT
jgi:hypothetical protein